MAEYQVDTGQLQAAAGGIGQDASLVESALSFLDRAADAGAALGNGKAAADYANAHADAVRSVQALSDTVRRVAIGLGGAAGTYASGEGTNAGGLGG